MTSPSSPPLRSAITLVAAGRTDRGRARANNEDALLISDLTRPALGGVAPMASIDIAAKGAIVVVSDGMGGMEAGEVASEMVVRLVVDEFAKVGWADPAWMRDAVASVNRSIWEASLEPDKRGMGATMTALYFLRDSVYLMQVGDSRAYLLRRGQLLQLTRDQTRVQMLLDAGALTPEQAAQSPDRNIVLQAMGTAPLVNVVLARLDLRQGDRLLVCSDGLSNKVEGPALRAALGRDESFEAIAQSLVVEANARGGQDNITAIVCGVAGPGLREPRSSDPASDLHAVIPEQHTTILPPPARAAVPTDPLFERLVAEAREQSHRGQYAPSLEAARPAIARARDLRSTELTVRAILREASALSLSARGEEALERLASILSLASEKPRVLCLTDLRVAHAVVSAHLDWVSVTGFIGPVPAPRRIEVLDRADALLTEIGRPDWRSGVLGMRSTLLRSLGRLEEAIRLEAEAIRAFSIESPGFTLASHRQQHADMLFETGRIEEAEREYRAILTDTHRAVRDEKSANVGIARCALRRGDLTVARRYAEEAVRIAGPLGDSAVYGALHVLGEVLGESGELDHAVAVADQLVERARKTRSPQRLFFAMRSQIDLAIKRSDGEGARDWLEEAEKLARLLDGPTGENRYGVQLQWRRARAESDAPPRS